MAIPLCTPAALALRHIPWRIRSHVLLDHDNVIVSFFAHASQWAVPGDWSKED